MYRKLSKMIWHKLKQEHLTMLVHKYGKINLMEQKVIFGHLAVFSIKWQQEDLRLQQLISKLYTKR